MVDNVYAKPKLIRKPDIYMYSAIALLDGQHSTHDSRNSASLQYNILHLSGSTQGRRKQYEIGGAEPHSAIFGHPLLRRPWKH